MMALVPQFVVKLLTPRGQNLDTVSRWGAVQGRTKKRRIEGEAQSNAGDVDLSAEPDLQDELEKTKDKLKIPVTEISELKTGVM
jgi:hypothetical protein